MLLIPYTEAIDDAADVNLERERFVASSEREDGGEGGGL